VTNKPKILVIEDEIETQRLLTEQLRAYGYRTEVAIDALSGLEAARIGRPDAVLLDMGLPLRGGLRVLERLGDTPSLAQVPVVLLAGRVPGVAVRHEPAKGVPEEKPDVVHAVEQALEETRGQARAAA
jgi:CheY-like chemotaxis protein